MFYDIPNDRVRTKVCDICADYGLDRHQYSVFGGCLMARQIRALAKELRQQMKTDGYIFILPVASTEWEKRIEIGSAIHE